MVTSTVGFVGLGTMGRPMAKNLLDAGYRVVGYDREPAAIEAFVEYGGAAAEDSSDVAARSEVIFTSLPDSEAAAEVVRGDDGLVSGLDGGETVIDVSTISPSLTEELAADLDAANAAMLDAPVSGGESGAIEGSLLIMVGGDRAVLAEHESVLSVVGDQITYCGPSGSGQVAKACNQIVVANTLQAISEALVLAERAGADLEAVVEALDGGAASCWALTHRAPRMIRGNFEPGFFAAYQYKDLRIATDAGEAVGAPLPITSLTAEQYKSMTETGLARDDNSGVLQILERLAGTEARIDR